MPKITTKQATTGYHKKTAEEMERHRLSKLNKKLPPLTSDIADSGRTEERTRQSGLNEKADSKRYDNATGKNRATNRRRFASKTGMGTINGGKTGTNAYLGGKPSSSSNSGSRQGTSTNSSASSGIQKRISAKPKVIDVEHMETQPQSKPRKRGSTKPKLAEKSAADGDGNESVNNDYKAAGSSLTNPQWTNIVKRVHIHKPKIRTRLLKRKEIAKRKKSDYVIENTWIPREPTNSPNSQTLSKRSKTKNGRARESRKTKDATNKTSTQIQQNEKVDIAALSSKMSSPPETEVQNVGSEPAEEKMIPQRTSSKGSCVAFLFQIM